MSLISINTLLLGAVLYIWLRPESYVGAFVRQLLKINSQANIRFIPISFYLPDLLWGMSLCSGLYAIYPINRKRMWLWGVVTFLYGTLWELAQKLNIVSGTADIFDVILYLVAAIVVVMINKYLEKGKEK